MSTLVHPIEIDGMIDENHHLILENNRLPVGGPAKVKVVITSVENDNIENVYGLFKAYAKHKLIEKENGAWRDAAVKKHASH